MNRGTLGHSPNIRVHFGPQARVASSLPSEISMANSDSVRTHYHACNLCEAICGLEIQTRGEEILSIRGDREDPLSRGHICPKAVALQDIHQDPDRLRHPMIRRGDDWQRIPWEEAFDRAAESIRQVQERWGRDAVAAYFGNPSVHNYGSLLFGPPFLRALGSKNNFSATSVDQLPHHLVASLLYGHQLLLPVPDLDHTDFLLILGANPAVSNGSMMTAPDVKKRLRAIRQRGGQVVVIDPRHTRTAKLADRHFFIRPGEDAFLLAAILHTLLDEGLADPAHLTPYLDGLEELRTAIQPFPPEKAAPATGIAADDIRWMARQLAAAPAAACYGRIGVSTHLYGTLCQWLIQVINIVTGNLDKPGGSLFSRPAVNILDHTSPGRRGRWRSRVRGLPEFGGELPVSALAEEIETEGPGQIRALVTSAGNPVLSTPNGGRLDRALPSLDTMISIDFYINETTRHAHLILPPTAALEHDHYDLVFHLLAIRNTARYSQPLFDPAPDTRHDWQIFLELQKRLERRGGAGGMVSTLKHRARRALGPAGLLDLALRRGPYGGGLRPFSAGLNRSRLEKEPHGVDLGPLSPSLPGSLRTRTQRIHLAPELLLEDLRRLEAQKAESAGEELRLIGRRQVRSNNSWMHNYPRLMRGKERCTLWLHPRDAERLRLSDGQLAQVRSRVGEVEAPVEITENIMPGVVSLPHGWGHRHAGSRLRVAQEQPGVSINNLTDESQVDPVSGNAVLVGVPVEILPAP